MSAEQAPKTNLQKPAYVKPTITTIKVDLSFASAPSSDLPPKIDHWFDTFGDSFLKRNKKGRGKATGQP
jgi:hypothetical protein